MAHQGAVPSPKNKGEQLTGENTQEKQDPKRVTIPISASLHTILTLPSILLIVMTTALVGYISFRNGQAAVNNVVAQLRNETALNIRQHLATFLNVPHQINQLNAYAIRSGELDRTDTGALQRYFLEQVKIHPSVSSVYFGTVEGGLIGGGREGADGALYVTSTEDQKSGTFEKFSMDEAGNVAPIPIATVPNFDARTRPWYISASQKGDAAWSDIYILFTGQDMAFAASRPVYDEENNLLGVVSVDIFLSQLSKYLETLSISPIGQVFIMEQSGALVATSTGETLFSDVNDDGIKERLNVSNSQSVVVREAGKLLTQKFGDYRNIPVEEQQLEFTLDGEKQFLQFMSVRYPYGIDWVIVTVIPESAFMEQIDAGNRTTIWLMLAALVIASALSNFTTSKITKRISQLNKSTQALAAGNWDLELETHTRIAELNNLALSFDRMKEQLRRTLNELTNEVEERKRAERALEEEIHRRFLLFEKSPDGILIIEPSTARIMEFNSAAHQQLGYTRAEFSQLSISDVEAVETSEETRSHIASVLQNGKDDFETLQHTKQGELRNVHVTAQIINIQGKPVYYCVWRDITDQKRAEEALRESEARFRAISEAAGDFIYMIDRDGRVRYANELAAQALGMTQKELIGLQLREMFPLEIYERQWQGLQKVFETGESSYLEAITHFPSGDLWQATWLTPLLDPSGNVTAVLGESRNISERKKMEEELHAQHEFATQLINLMGQGLTVTDKEGRFEFVNPAYARLLNREPEDLIGKYPRDVTVLEEQSSLDEQRQLRRAGQTTTYASRLRRADGSTAYVLITGVPRGHDGHYEGAIAVVTDLTEQKRIEEELLQAKGALELMNKKLEQSLTREQHLARIDELTGINNRRHLLELGAHKFAVAQRYRQPLTVLMFDIDHFKNINDIFGHAIGDQVLIRVAQIASAEMRSADTIGRYGGEEFIILLPMTNAYRAFLLAERIRKSVADMQLPSGKGNVSITLSIGIAELEHDSPTELLEDVFRRADEAMYEAKRAGRNRTMIYGIK